MCSKVFFAVVALLAAAPTSAISLSRPTYKQHQKGNQAVSAALKAVETQLEVMPELKRALAGMDMEDLKYEVADAAYNAVTKGKGDPKILSQRVQRAVQKILPGASPANEIARDTVKGASVAEATIGFEDVLEHYKEMGGSPRTAVDYIPQGHEHDSVEQYDKAHQAVNAALDSLQVQMEEMPELKRAVAGMDYEDLKYDVADAAFNAVLKGGDISQRVQAAVQKILPGPSPSGEIARMARKNMETAKVKVSFEDIAKHYKEVGGTPRTTVFKASGVKTNSGRSEEANQALNAALESLQRELDEMPEIKRALTQEEEEELKYTVAKAAYNAIVKDANLKDQVQRAVQKILPGDSPSNEISRGTLKNLKTAEIKVSFEDISKRYAKVAGGTHTA